MANERTFLAWLRTSLSLISIGIGIVQLFKLKDDVQNEPISRWGKPIGGGFIVLGIYTLAQGYLRFFRVQQLLLADQYPASRHLVVTTVGAVLVLVASTLVVVMVH